MKTEALTEFLVTFHERETKILVDSQWLQEQLLMKNALQLQVKSLEKQLSASQSLTQSTRVSQEFYKDFYHSTKTLDTSA